ncbi:MAG: hypothetical protein RMK99_03115 [Anaerolineales bacterium]|nr:hypothetical protein [Anaerolineales bacterium]
MPIDSGKLVRVYSFSPSRELLAYWTSTDLPPLSFEDPAGQIKFLKVSTGQVCTLPGVYGYGSRLTWEQDDTVVVISGGAIIRGAPCEMNITGAAPADYESSDVAMSIAPEGSYKAETHVRYVTVDGIEARETRITNLLTGKTEDLVRWRAESGVRGPAGAESLSLGGQWIRSDLFLVYKTLDEGPLLIKVGEDVIRIASELFGLPDSAVFGGQSFTYEARAAAPGGSKEFHVLLFGGSGLEADFPPVRLFHSDTRQVETLPFRRVWEPAFSPDGRWLLLSERPRGEDDPEDYALWIRPVVPVGSQPRELVRGDLPAALWTSDWTKLAFGGSSRVVVLSFPEGLEIGVWSVGNYTAIPRAWSSDGKLLALEGYVPEKQNQALFLITLP